MGSLCVTFLALSIAIKIKMAACNFSLFLIVGVRIVTTFLVLHFIESKTAGFELIDRK